MGWKALHALRIGYNHVIFALKLWLMQWDAFRGSSNQCLFHFPMISQLQLLYVRAATCSLMQGGKKRRSSASQDCLHFFLMNDPLMKSIWGMVGNI